MDSTADERSRVRRFLTHPALWLLLLAPVFGECLSGSTPPLDLLLPWNLGLMVALYGCGALLCREVAHRCRLGFPGLVLLGVAYGVVEEALVDRYWFYPTFWHDTGVGDYSVVGGTNVLLAVHLTAFHTAVSICCSVLVVEWLSPSRRDRPWTRWPGLVLAGLALASTPVLYGGEGQPAPVAGLVVAGGLVVAAVGAAFAVGRASWRRSAVRRPKVSRPQRRGLAAVAFATVLAHWVATYGIAETTVPWPLGVATSLAPLALGAVAVTRLAVTGAEGPDGMRVVVGVLAFFAVLDALVGLAGRYDLSLGGLALGAAAWALHRSATRDLSRRRARRRSTSPAR